MNRIIIFSALDLWSMSNGTGAPSFFKTVDAYVQSGWDVVLVNPNSTSNNSYNAPNLRQVSVNTVFNNQYKSKLLKFVTNLISSLYLTKQFIRIGRTNILNSQTVLYAYEVHAVKAVKKLSKKYNNKIVTRFQGTILSRVDNNLINRVGYYPHFQALKEKSDLIIMTDDGSFGDKVLLELENKSPMKFWRNGVDINQSENVSDNSNLQSLKEQYIERNERILMTVSRVVNWKRIDRAIRLTKSLLDDGIDVKLLIVGDGPDIDSLKQLATSLQIMNKVVFVGAVEQKQIPDYLAIADVFLSLYDLSNLGNPMFEAMKCGKAIVTLNNGNTASVITNGENAIMLDPKDIEELPVVVKHLLNDSALYKKISLGAKAYADQNFYSWDTRMKMELDAVKNLITK